MTNPSRPRSNGRLAAAGSSFRRDSAEPGEPGHAERVHHALRPARDHGVRVPGPDQLGRLAHRLRAGRARRQARGVRAVQGEQPGEAADGRVHLDLGLAPRVEGRPEGGDEPRRVGAAAGGPGRGDRRGPDERVEVFRPLADPEVDADPPPVAPALVQQPRVLEGLLRGPDREPRVRPAAGVPIRVLQVPPEVEARHLRGERGGQRPRVEPGDRPDRRAPGRLGGEQLGDRVPQRGDDAHPGNDHPPPHVAPPRIHPHRRTTSAPHCPRSVAITLTA